MRWIRVVVITLVILLAGLGAVSAREVIQGDQCQIEAGRTIEGNLLALCRTLVVDGHVTGNLLGAATTAVINGQVDGNVYLISGQLDVRGSIGDDLHFGGLVLRVHENAEFTDPAASLLSASLSSSLGPDTELGGSITAIGYQLLLDGNVNSEVDFWGSALVVSGDVSGDIYAEVGDNEADVSQLETLLIPLPIDLTLVRPGLRVANGAHVTGQITYSSPNEAQIEGQVDQDPIFNPVVVQPDFTQIGLGEEDQFRGLSLYLSQVVREFLSLVLIGVIALLVAPRSIQAPLRNIQVRPLPCVGVGLLAFIISFVAVPAVLVLTTLLIFIIALLQINELTVAFAALISVVDVGLASVLFFIVLFISRVVFGLALGKLLTRLAIPDDGSLRRNIISLVVGVLITALLTSIPAVGWILNALTAFVGLGAILLIVQARAETARENAPVKRYVAVQPPTLPRRYENPGAERVLAAPPPPPIDTTSEPVGMDNLPDGFQWWDD
jgi:hypothetical protein